MNNKASKCKGQETLCTAFDFGYVAFNKVKHELENKEWYNVGSIYEPDNCKALDKMGNISGVSFLNHYP